MTPRLALLAALLAVSSFTATAAEAEVRVKTGKDDPLNLKVERDVRDRNDRAAEDRVYAREEKVGPENRASQLIGMEIRNKENQKLGVVKDVVLDLKAGNVSYVVLGAGGMLGFREKLIAVPTAELTMNDAARVLIVDASQQQIDRLPGFAATNWPLPNDPNWGPKSFNKVKVEDEDTVKAAIDKPRVKLDARAGDDIDLSIGRPAGSERGSSAKTKVYQNTKSFKGEVLSVDLKGRQLVARDEDGLKREFRLEETGATRSVSLKETLREIRRGDHVSVSYHQEADGDRVAHSVLKVENR